MIDTSGAARFFRPGGKRALIPLVLFAIGCVLITLQFLNNLAGYVTSLFVPVQHPTTYSAPAFDALVAAHVREGLVDYAALARDERLAKALKELATTGPERLVDPRDQMAFWINAYHLVVIKNVVDEYPIATVRKIGRRLSLKKYLVGGKTYSATDIESMQLTPRLRAGDPRALFLICGAAVGYPSLPDHALSGSRLEEDMTKATWDYMNNPENVNIDQDTGVVLVTPFIRWNWAFFHRHYRTPMDLIVPYLNPLRKLALASQKMTQDFTPRFNWWLNDTALKGRDEPLEMPDDAIENLNLIPYSQPDSGGGEK